MRVRYEVTCQFCRRTLTTTTSEPWNPDGHDGFPMNCSDCDQAESMVFRVEPDPEDDPLLDTLQAAFPDATDEGDHIRVPTGDGLEVIVRRGVSSA